MPRIGLALLAVVPFLAGCQVGLDPRNLERLRYGMEQQHVAELLESDVPPVPMLRFFAEDEHGQLHDVLVELYETVAPHPLYTLTSIDSRLAAATLVRGPFAVGAAPDPDPEPQDRANVCPWTSAELRSLQQRIVATRAELAWSALAAAEAEQKQWPRPGSNAQAIVMAIVFVVPALLYVPYWAYSELFVDDGCARAETMRAFLLAAPAATTAEQVVASLGPPSSDSEHALVDGEHRVLAWTFADFCFAAGFRGDQLRWVDFGSGHVWVQESVR